MYSYTRCPNEVDFWVDCKSLKSGSGAWKWVTESLYIGQFLHNLKIPAVRSLGQTVCYSHSGWKMEILLSMFRMLKLYRVWINFDKSKWRQLHMQLLECLSLGPLLGWLPVVSTQIAVDRRKKNRPQITLCSKFDCFWLNFGWTSPKILPSASHFLAVFRRNNRCVITKVDIHLLRSLWYSNSLTYQFFQVC